MDLRHLRISTDSTTTDPCTLAEVVAAVVEAMEPTTSPSTLTEMLIERLTSMSPAGEEIEAVTVVASAATGVATEVDMEIVACVDAVDSVETVAIIWAMAETEETMVASEVHGEIAATVVSRVSAVASAVTEETGVDLEAMVAEAIIVVAIKVTWEGKIKRIKSTVSIRMTLQVELETTTMMTIRLSTISMAEMIEKEKTDTKKTCQHLQSSMAAHVSEAQLVVTETCACEAVLVQAMLMTNLGQISVVDMEIVGCVDAA